MLIEEYISILTKEEDQKTFFKLLTITKRSFGTPGSEHFSKYYIITMIIIHQLRKVFFFFIVFSLSWINENVNKLFFLNKTTPCNEILTNNFFLKVIIFIKIYLFEIFDHISNNLSDINTIIKN